MPTLLLKSQTTSWIEELPRHLPDLKVRHHPDIGDPAAIDYALVWRPPPGLLKSLPNLKVIFSLGAGVDHILADPELPAGIPIVRLSDPHQCNLMSEYALLAVLHFHRAMPAILADQLQAKWTRQWPIYTPETAVGVLGLGDIGQDIARKFTAIGFPVHGWSRSPKQIDGITCHHGPAGLRAMLPLCRYIICVLPLTEATLGIIDAALLQALPPGAYVINMGRGGHVVDKDMLAALDTGQIAGAFLDVFDVEPLPPAHPYWRHPKIVVTPHCAGEVVPSTAAQAIVANIRRHLAGDKMHNVYQPDRGY
jgi:glyoxylate/hydroxypyruvate reductase A